METSQPEKLANNPQAAAWDNYHANRELVENLDGRLNRGYWKTKELEQQHASFLLPDAALAAELARYETFFIKLLGQYCKTCDENKALWQALRPIEKQSES